MRSSPGRPLTTALVFLTLFAFALLGVFGVPQFAPVVASPSGADRSHTGPVIRAAGAGESARHTPDDLFAPVPADASGHSRLEPDERFATGATVEHAAAADPGSFEFADKRQRLRSNFSDNSNGAGQSVDNDFERGSNSAARDGWSLPPAQAAQTDASTAARGIDPFDERAVLSDADLAEPIHSGTFAAFQEDRQSGNPTGLREPGAKMPSKFQPAPYDGFLTSNGAAERGSDNARPANVPFASTRGIDDRTARDPVRNSEPLTSPGQATGPLTWQAAVQHLNRLGIRHFQLKPGERTNDFHFSCLFTPEGNPRLTHRFEAEANEPLRAVEKVLNQIDEWLRRR